VVIIYILEDALTQIIIATHKIMEYNNFI
jgi:hypothetical protein